MTTTSKTVYSSGVQSLAREKKIVRPSSKILFWRHKKFSPAIFIKGYGRSEPLHLSSFSDVTAVDDFFLVFTCFFSA